MRASSGSAASSRISPSRPMARPLPSLAGQALTVSLTEEAKAYLVEKGFDPHYGARPLQRSIQRLLEDPLAEDILSKKVAPGTSIYVQVDDTGQKLVFSTTPPQKTVKNG